MTYHILMIPMGEGPQGDHNPSIHGEFERRKQAVEALAEIRKKIAENEDYELIEEDDADEINVLDSGSHDVQWYFSIAKKEWVNDSIFEKLGL